MYREMFGLHTAPFNNTPDPKFFYNTPDHEEALASLQYAACERKGFVLVTGEVGTGKTLLSRLLTQRLPSGTKTAVLTHTRLRGRELLWAVCREFGIEVAADAPVVLLLQAIEAFLLEQYARDRLAILVLDESQNLPIESFEELRLLGNLEADDAKLLQVMFLGQPELQQTLRRAELRQIAQRVFRSYHLTGMTQELTAGYIRHRLAVAGAEANKVIFEDDALAAVYRHSQGLPRLINQLCDHAMLAAYADSRERIGRDLIDEVAGHLLMENPSYTALPAKQSVSYGSRAEAADAADTTTAEPRVEVDTRRTLQHLQQRIALLETRTDARPVALESEKNAMREEFRRLYEEMRQQALTIRHQWKESSEQHHEEFRGIVEAWRSEGESARLHAKQAAEQQRGEFEQWRLEVQALADQLRKRIRALDERLTTVDEFIREQATPIGEERRLLREEVRGALEAMSRTQARFDADVKKRREETERFTDHSRRLLTETREQAASLLSGLRLHLGETCDQAAESWRCLLEAGKAEAQQLEARVAQARAQAATSDAALEKSLYAIREALAQASSDGGRVRQELTRQTEQARQEMEHLAQRHQRALMEAFETERRGFTEAAASERQRLETVLEEIKGSEAKFADWRAQLVEAGTKLEAFTTDLHVRLDGAKELSAVLRGDLDEILRSTQKAVGTLEEHGRTFATALMHRISQCARDAKKAQAQAQSAVDEITRARDGSLAQMRSAFVQMHERAEHARVDLSALAEEVRLIAAQCVERLRDLRSEETGRLEGLAESAAGLLQQATATLAEVTSVSREAKRESREALDQAQSVQFNVEQSQQRVREVHAEALSLLQESATAHEQARMETQASREELANARRDLETMIAMPREMIAESQRQAAALSELANRITSVYQKLSTALARAANEHEALEIANTEASGTLKQLRLHAQRVGQLVGIIRQVYGAMDARVERIARGLTSAEEIFREVPREIDAMREALGTARLSGSNASPANSAVHARATTGAPRRSKLTSGGPKVLPRPKHVSELPFAKGTLGEIAQRSQKLNAWLKDILAREEEVKLVEDNADRLGQSTSAISRERVGDTVNAGHAKVG